MQFLYVVMVFLRYVSVKQHSHKKRKDYGNNYQNQLKNDQNWFIFSYYSLISTFKYGGPKGAKYGPRNKPNVLWNTQNLFCNVHNVSLKNAQNLSWNSQNVCWNTQNVSQNIQKVLWNAQNIQRDSKNLITWNTENVSKTTQNVSKIAQNVSWNAQTLSIFAFPDLWYFLHNAVVSWFNKDRLTRYKTEPRAMTNDRE